MSPVIGLISQIDAAFDYTHSHGCNNTVENAESCSECCRQRYFAGTGIDYSCPQFQQVYVMRYLPVHIRENFVGLRRAPREALDEISQKEIIRFASFGGGPGSDVAAFKQFLCAGYLGDLSTKNVQILRIDNQEDWNGLAKSSINLFKPEVSEISHIKMHADVTEEISDRYSEFQFVTISYLLSELDLDDIPGLARNINILIDDVCVIVINDRNECAVVEKAESLLRELGVNDYSSDSNVSHCNVFFPDELVERVKPKLQTSSIRYTAVVRS